MAITNAQQYKQLLAQGGRIGLKGGSDAKDFKSTPGPKNSPFSSGFKGAKKYSPTQNNTGSYDRAGVNEGPGVTAKDREIIGDGLTTQRSRFVDRRNYPKIKLGLFDTLTGGKATKKFVDFSSAINRPYFYDKVTKTGRLDPEKFGISYYNLQDYTDDELEDAYQKYDRARLRGEIDAFGNPIVTYGKDQGEYSDNIMSENEKRLLALEEAAAGTPEVEDDQITNYRLLADGGRAGFAEGGMPYEGGIMDLESGRQMYFLGKLVKKATRAVKKIVKSPIGKAALLAAPFAFPAARSGLASFLFKNPMAKGSGFGGFMEMLKGGMTGGGKFALGAGLTLAPFLAGDQEEEEPMYAGADLPNPVDYYLSGKYRPNERLAADGGLMRLNYQEGGDAEPVAKKTMPLLDMDGQEMDLREEGGFVPLGRMERADDVPARLSKNEFVFTADAVRNAGEGDVDKGAEVMYNMMKNLESGGEVSEESQGLESAREMFQTSQRLEEVI